MSSDKRIVRVLMVCLGNICRSPTAHAVFEKRVADAGLSERIKIDSAGTGDYHIGAKPDKRSRDAGAQRGYDLSALRARQVSVGDFASFDYVLAMDDNNLNDLVALSPAQHHSKISLFMEFADNSSMSVPDPYYSDSASFQLVLNLVEEAAEGLLTHIRQKDLS